jgi:hypothetical protein
VDYSAESTHPRRSVVSSRHPHHLLPLTFECRIGMSNHEQFIIKAYQLHALTLLRPLFVPRLSAGQKVAINWVVSHFPRSPVAVLANWANRYANAVVAAQALESCLPDLVEFHNSLSNPDRDRSISSGEPINQDRTTSDSSSTALTDLSASNSSS